MDRLYEVENLRRSIAAAPPQSQALTREQAAALLAELQATERRLRALRDGLRKLLADEP